MSQIFVYSGEDIISSRKAFLDHLESLKLRNLEEMRINGKDISDEALENILGSQTLFGEKRVLSVENFLTGQKTKEKEKILEKILSFKDATVIFWENKDFSRNEQLKFSQCFIFKNFKLPSSLFVFLESLSPKNIQENLLRFRNAIAAVDPNFIFLMMVRQIRLLILSKNINTKLTLPPWQISKLKKQANLFELENLIEIYKKLQRIDFEQKTSSSPFPLEHDLELLLFAI